MKSINLFGQEEHVFTNRGKSQKGLFNDYEGFVEKFKPKKTTDDCYTPPAVYDYVLVSSINSIYPLVSDSRTL